MAQQSMRRGRESQDSPECFEHAALIWSPVRELPYGPATHERSRERPDRCQHPTTRNTARNSSCIHRGVHRWRMVQEPKDNKSNLSGGKKDFADRRDCRSNITEPKEKAAKWWCSAPCVLSLEMTMTEMSPRPTDDQGYDDPQSVVCDATILPLCSQSVLAPIRAIAGSSRAGGARVSGASGVFGHIVASLEPDGERSSVFLRRDHLAMDNCRNGSPTHSPSKLPRVLSDEEIAARSVHSIGCRWRWCRRAEDSLPWRRVADVFRRYGEGKRQFHGGHLGRVVRRVMSAVEMCWTARSAGKGTDPRQKLWKCSRWPACNASDP